MSSARLFIGIPRAMCVMLTIPEAKKLSDHFRSKLCHWTFSVCFSLFGEFIAAAREVIYRSFIIPFSFPTLIRFHSACASFGDQLKITIVKFFGPRKKKAFICDHLENFSTLIFFIIIILSLRPSVKLSYNLFTFWPGLSVCLYVCM